MTTRRVARVGTVVLVVIGVVLRAALVYVAVLLTVEAIQVAQEYVVFEGNLLWRAVEDDLTGLVLGIGGCVFGFLLLPSPWRRTGGEQ